MSTIPSKYATMAGFYDKKYTYNYGNYSHYLTVSVGVHVLLYVKENI